MKDITTALMQQFRREHKAARRYMALLLALALLTSLFVNWELHSVGIAQTADYQCGEIEHQHTAECYEKVLVCGYEEGEPEDWNATKPDDSAFPDADYGVEQSEADIAAYSVEPEPEYIFVPHQHTDDCYQEVKTLTCYQEEHVHTDDCFDPEDGSLICDLFEHTHDDSCYTVEYELVCGLEEGELVEEPNPDYVPVDEEASAVFDDAVALQPIVDDSSLDTPVHHHTDACYEEVLVCGLPEHHHTVNCLSDPLADVEDEETWSAKTNVVLTGAWADDLTAVAKSQLGYQQSERNFQLDDEDQTTVRHYTRYGAWYGNAYGAWDVMFLSYCLNYANVPQTTVPQRAGVQALRSDLRGSEWLKAAAEVELVPGDIVFYNSITTETVAVEEDAPQIMDDSADADIALLSLEPAAAEPQTEERTVSTETVGIVSDVDADTGTLTVISGDVDGKVAEVSLRADEITDVIDLAAADKAQGSTEKDDELDADTDAAYAPSTDNDGFGATVEWVGEAAEADPYGIALLADSGDAHDLNEWITNVSYKQYDKKNDKWYDIGSNGNATVNSGDTVQVNLKYTVNAGVLTPTNNELTYQLPGGLTLPEEQTGNIVDEERKDANGEYVVVGRYTIDTDGRATLTFTDQKFIGTNENGGAPFTGTFHFSREMKADDFESNKEIKFTDNCTLTIKPKQDVTILKLGAADGRYKDDPDIRKSLVENLPDGTFRVNYVVEVLTNQGTKNPVTITDTLNAGNASDLYKLLGTYEEGTFVFYKVDAQGNKVKQSFPQYTLTEGTDTKEIKIQDLPALNAGEKYIWCYSVIFDSKSFNNSKDGTGLIRNRAVVSCEGLPDVGYNQKLTMQEKRITKTGTYKAEDGQIEWKIVVSVPNSVISGNFLVGYIIQDALPEGTQIVGNVKVGNKTITADKFLNGGKGYTITADDMSGKNKLEITFRTNTPVGGDEVTNTATATKDGVSFIASDTVDLQRGEWDLSKKLAASGKNPTWNISASNKAGEESFTLWDVLSDAVNNAGDVQKDTHYAYAAELDSAIKAGLTLTMHNGTKLSYHNAVSDENTIEITYYSDADGKTVVNENDTETKVRSFKIKVTAGSNMNPVRSIEVTGIPTHEERGNVPNGEIWTYKNSIHIDGVSGTASAEDSYRSYKKFEKLVAANSNKNESGYVSGSNSFELSEVSGGNLHYQLVLNPAADDTAEITVTDTLPENSKLNTNTIKIALDDGEFNKIDSKLKWASYDYKDASKLLTIKIKDYNNDNTEHKIRIVYDVGVDERYDPTWKNPAVGKLTYTNTATWGNLNSSTNTTLTRDVDEVKKTGVKLSNNRARYQVVINPAGQDLSANKDHAPSIELWDNVSATNDAIVNGDRDSVKLYYYKYDETNGVILGDEVPRELYRILDASDKGWLHMVIPNEMAMILVYECEVKSGNAASSYDVNNTVTLSNGSEDKSDKLGFIVKSDATASTGLFRLHKVDSYSGESLGGAEFTIYQYDPKSKGWTLWNGATNGIVTTDKKGQVELTVLADKTDCLNPDVLYKIVETKAPENYRLDGTLHYVLFRTSTQTNQQAFEAATGVTTDTSVLMVGSENIDLSSNVQVGAEGKTTEAKYSNVYSRLTVKKLWLDQATKQPVDPAVNEIWIKVWQYTDDVTKKTEFANVSLNKDNEWSFTWSGNDLPLEDDNHETYHYLVEEVTTGNWNVVIDNNDVQTGNIIIQNRVFKGYVLPSTGGMGTVPFAAVGGMLTVGAALLLAKRKKHEEKGE